jgi:signal transduction histidine kinase
VVERFKPWRGKPVLVDVAAVAGLACLSAVEFARSSPDDPTMSGLAPKLLAATIILALLFRRRAPFTVLVVAASTEFVWILLRDNTPGSADRALLVAIYTVAAYKDPRWGVAAVGMGLFAWSLLPVRNLCICLIDIGAVSAFAVIAGHSMLVGRRVNRELEEQTELLRRTRAERVRLAVSEERVRVAREMHDVVAHWVTGMVVQAGGARMVLADDPALAAATLGDIQQMGREALDELHALVSTLDPRDGTDRTSAHEDAYELDSLVHRLHGAGQEVTFIEEGEAHVDEGLQISVYRIVQEALTNVRKHAPGATASVLVRYGPEGVDVSVSNGPNTGARPTPPSVPGAGQGLIGISERAAVFGGDAEAGPTPDGGFRVHVRLPMELVPA